MRSLAVLGVVAWLLGGCAGEPAREAGEIGLPDDLPVREAPPLKDGTPPLRADILAIPDALPRPEPLTMTGNKSPYTVLGRTYRVMPSAAGHRERGLGSWYGTKFHGQKTSLGEDYDVYAMTAAHKTLPIPCFARVTNLENGKRIIVRVNDRGPFHAERMIDLSFAAAYRLGYADRGTAMLELEVLDPQAPEWVARRNASGATSRAVAAAGGAPARRTWLQAGAFRSMDSARSLQQTLTPQIAQEVAIHSQSGWHRVRVGPLETTSALQQVRERLLAMHLGAQVITE
jgi:rare lipoprotein A